MDDVHAVGQEAFGGGRGVAVRGGHLRAGMVQARDQVELPGQPEIGQRDVMHRDLRAQHGEAHGQEAVVAGEPALAQAFHLAARHGDLVEWLLPGLRVRLGRPVQEERADARLVQSGDGAIRVVGRGIVVVPVHEGRHAGIDLVQRADEVGDVDVLRPEERRQAGMHHPKIVRAGPVAGEPAQPGLPGVDMGVHEAGDDDHVRRIDHGRAVARVQLRADRRDLVILDQDIAAVHIGDRRVHRHDGSALQKGQCHCGPLRV